MIQWQVLQPYISASLGIGFNDAYNFTITPTTFAAIATPPFSSTTTTSFTYTLGIGVQRMLSPHWRVGMGYEFADWGATQLGRADGQTLNHRLSQGHLYTNGIQLNVTYHV